MDPHVAHPPVDQAAYIFYAFTRIYFTHNQPIDFNQQYTPEQIPRIYIQYSEQARHVLLQIYGLLQPLVATDPIKQQSLETAYLYAVQMIHTKFGTNPTSHSALRRT
jgi:hypothetical protein